MKNIEIYNTLNIDKDSSSIVATFTQEDDAVMEFKLFKDGQEIVLKDQTISLGAERKDGAVIEQDDGFLIKENNVLNITLKKNIISVVGVVKIQLYLKDTSGEMASNTFNIRVNKKLLGAENIEATNDIKTLNTLVLELKNNTNKLIDDTKAKADKLLNGLQETGDNISSTVKAKTDKLIEDTKKDYDSLKKTIIDENISIKLQEDIKTLQNGLKTNQNLSYEGSSITAENTLEGRTENMMIKGKTLLNIHSKSNYSFATSIPQENYTLSEGQNFCEVTIKKYPSSSYYYINAGTINFDLLKPNQKYTLLAKATDGLYPSIMTGGYEFPLTSGGTSFKNGVATMTTNNLVNGSKGQILYINLNGGATYKQELRDVMIFEGDLNIVPSSYFDEISSFGEAEQEGDKYKISILSHGKNFVDFNAQIQDRNATTHKILPNGIQVTSPSDNRQYWCHSALRVKLKKNTNYYCSFKYKTQAPGIGWVAIRTINDTLIKDLILNNGSFNSGDNDEIDVQFYASLGSPVVNNSVIYYDFQIEEGTIQTPYEPYKCDKKDILLTAPLREGDYLYEDNGQITVYRDSHEHIFTGEGTWFLQSINSYGIANFGITIPLFKNTKYSLSNKFKLQSTVIAETTDEGYFLSGSNDTLYIRIASTKADTLEKFKTLLRQWNTEGNPLTVVYQLANPAIEIVENCVDIDLDTYQDVTYVNILNSLPGELDFKVPSNIGSSLQSLAKEVNNIWDVINNLLVPSLIETNKNIALATIKNNLK